jgi:hypothetical protein
MTNKGSPSMKTERFMSCIWDAAIAKSRSRASRSSAFADPSGEGDDEVVWQVHATGGDSTMDVIVGVVGEGYEEDVPLSEPLRGQYTIVVTTSVDDAVQGVDVARLEPGTIDTGLDLVSPAEFERQAMEACG